jgi:tRNA pseudouridine55 synthase
MLSLKKAGHCGTLDPQAEGLLVVALGSATRLLRYISFEPKTYEFGILFGSETDSFDSEGMITAQGGTFPPETQLRDCLKQFTGIIEQVPPAFSAVHVDGVRAYTLARQGTIPELSPRKITVYDLQMTRYDTDEQRAEFVISCSTGTYIRSLVRDIAHTCNTYGTAQFIRRLSAGVFSLKDAIDLETTTEPLQYCIPAERIFNAEDIIEIDSDQLKHIRFGQSLAITDTNESGSTIFARNNESIVAVLRKKPSGIYHPETVF